MPACPPPTIRTSKTRGLSMLPFPQIIENDSELLADYSAIVADDLDGFGVGMENAHLHRGGGEQEPEDAVLEVCGVRRLDPPNLSVREVRVGGNEPLQQEAQGDAQGESEDDAAEDQEVQRPAQIQPDPERCQEKDRG